MSNAFKTFSRQKQDQIIEEGAKLCQGQTKLNYSDIKRQLDKKYDTNINLGTLRNRFLEKHQSRHKAHGKQQLLSRVQEDTLVEWIILLAETGHAISKRTLRKKAEIICGTKPGSTWIRTFLKRHPDVVLGKPSGLDPKRAQAFNQSTVARHFDLLKAMVDKHNIPVENIYNMDEKGVQRGGGRKTQARKYFVPRNKRPKYKLRSGNLELITIVECVCADGSWIYPGIIFQGKSQYETAWFEVHEKISYVPFNAALLTYAYSLSVGLSENGWTQNHLCLQWFRDNFIPQSSARNTSGRPILLIYDGHGSHETLEMLQAAKENNIILYSLPPHTTHKLQPLDVGVFGPFSRAWIEHCDEYVEEYLEDIPRHLFVKHYMEVRGHTFKDTTIRSAFRASGCWPVNCHVFENFDYAPSISTSTVIPDVPASYPIQVDWPEHQSWSDDEPELNGDGEDEDENIAPSPQTPPTSLPPQQHTPSVSLPSPIPPSRFYSKIPRSIPRRGRDTEAYISALEAEVLALRHENEATGAHAVMAFDQVRSYKRRFNAKSTTSKRRKLNTDARWLNSDKALAEAEAQREVELADEARRQEARDKKMEEEHERQREREQRDPNEPFKGALGGRNKAELQDVAFVLGLSVDGKNSDIKARIEAHFDEHENLRSDPRYIALFPSFARQARTYHNNLVQSTNHPLGQSNLLGTIRIPPRPHQNAHIPS